MLDLFGQTPGVTTPQVGFAVNMSNGNGIQIFGGNPAGAQLGFLTNYHNWSPLINDASVQPAFTINNSVAITAPRKLLSLQNNGVDKRSVDANGKTILPTGGAAPVIGQATLVAGTLTVATTAVTAASIIFLSRAVLGAGALGNLSYTISAGVSFTINTGTATEVSTVNWEIKN
jgi:hypothetical protein